MKYDFDREIDRKNTSCLKYDFSAERGRPDGVLPLWVADMDLSAPPAVLEALKRRADHGVFGYSMPKREYFESVAGWFRRRHGWNADPEKFVCTPGVVFALCALIRTVTREGDGVICCQPVYYPFEESVKKNRRRLVVSELRLTEGKYTVDFEDFERKIAENNVKAFLLCSPHNPVGRVWTEGELARLGDICMRHGVFVIADEIHADFTAEGYVHRVFPTVKREYEDHCAVCTSPSKTFNLAGLQISNIYLGNDAIRKKFTEELGAIGYQEPNVMGMTACVAAYDRCGDWLDCLKEYLAGNLSLLREFLREKIPEIRPIEPEGTYLVWLDCRALGFDDVALRRFIEDRAHLWLDDGAMFGAGGSGFERINIACPRSTLLRALGQLGRAVEEWRKGV